MADIDDKDLFDAFAYAETGSERNPYIRTRVAPVGGSSAFGPVQITHTKLKDYVDRKLLTPQSLEFATKVLLPMQAQMLYYGKEPNKPGYKPEFDYGGTGDFDASIYGPAYERLAREMLTIDHINSDLNIDKTIEKWRGTSEDKKYNEKVKQKLQQILKVKAMQEN